MKRRLLQVLLASAVTATTLALGGHADAHPAAARCVTLQVTGKTAAVRKPRGNAVSASPSSPVQYRVRRGDRLRSCLMTHNRTTYRGQTLYTMCGRGGVDWYYVRGGQIPQTCVKVV
ncbi:hypothetical protein [Streptomyces sp. NPDC053367]|uniref:hypothetical protein n=1 Tax=Streptomyces sp. NPDC053367 TaxID=3365700 RepID=UPI0037D2EF05